MSSCVVTYFVLCISIAFAHDGHHHHQHTSDHLQPISGNCDKLAPLVKVNPEKLHGKSWIIHNDSYIEDPDEVCEVFSTRYENGILYTKEEVRTASGKSWDVNVQLKPDTNREGYYIEDDGEIAVVLMTDKNLDMLCFAECGKLEGREGYGAHVFCGTEKGQANTEQLELIEKALKEANNMGLNLPSYPLKNSGC